MIASNGIGVIENVVGLISEDEQEGWWTPTR